MSIDESSDAKELLQDLEPLLQFLTRGAQRLVVRPGYVSLDRLSGTERVEVLWDAEVHARVLSRLPSEGALRLGADGPVGGYYQFEAQRVGQSLVLTCAADAVVRVQELVDGGWLSPLAARFLDASLADGRNILVTGPQLPARHLIAALLNGGSRPVWVEESAAERGFDDVANPALWERVWSVDEARAYGADRLGVCGAAAIDVGAILGEAEGCIAWIDGGRPDRSMMRLELALGGAADGASALEVLSALDLVIALEDHDGPRVAQITEIANDGESYLPRPLFLRGIEPAPHALVPVAAATFLDTLGRRGDPGMVEELRHIGVAPMATERSGASVVPQHSPRVASAAGLAPEDSGATSVPVAVARVSVPLVAAVDKMPKPVVAAETGDMPSPGWELDQLDDSMPMADDGEGAPGDADSALMAASYGLAPPPRPSDDIAPGPVDATFAGALRRARQRDAQLQAELSGEE